MGARLEGKICTSYIHVFEVMSQTAGSVSRRIGADAVTIISRNAAAAAVRRRQLGTARR
jgi:hypothetical protein